MKHIQKYSWMKAPIFAFLITRIIVILGGFYGEVMLPSATGEGLWHAQPNNVLLDIWARWDSGFYLKIIEQGYSYTVGKQSSVAFFPLYPLLSNLVNGVVNNPVLAAIIVSNTCLLIALIFLYRLTELEFGEGAAGRAVFYIAVFPTAFFFSAVYTESTFLMLAVATMYFARRRMWTWAALAGMLTSATRIIGFIFTAVVFLEWMRAQGWTLSNTLKRETWVNMLQSARREWYNIVLILLIPLGVLSYMFFLNQQFNDPLAFWSVQSAWQRKDAGPIATLVNNFTKLSRQDIASGNFFWNVSIDVTAAIAALVMGVIVWRKLGPSYALYTLAGVLIPLNSGMGSMARYVVVLFPIFMLLGLWGRCTFLDRAIVIGSCVFLGLFSAVFVNWVFIG